MTRRPCRFALAATFAAGHSFAAMFPPQPGDLVASMPFSFQLGEKTMRAGEYLIRLHESAVEICEDGVYCETVPIGSADGRKSGDGKLGLFFANSRDGRRLVRVIGLLRRNGAVWMLYLESQPGLASPSKALL